MEAKKEFRTKNNTRINLGEQIPLSVPLTVFIDPTNMCNFKCSFCPTGDSELLKKVGREQKLMSFDLYKKIIDDFNLFNTPIKVLRLWKDGEPLIHPKLPEMIRYAKQSGSIEIVECTTNGSLLSNDLVDKLINSGIDKLNISLEGVTKEQYQKFAKYNIDFEEFIQNIAYLFKNKKDCMIYIKANGDYLTEDEKRIFYDIFGKYADKIFLEHFTECWPDFNMDNVEANKEVNVFGNKLSDDYIEVCPYLFYAPAINANGKVSLCCNDWSMGTIFGDLNFESFIDIWNGDKHREYQMLHLKGDRKTHPVCGKCNRLQYWSEDNIDIYKNELLLKIESGKTHE